MFCADIAQMQLWEIPSDILFLPTAIKMFNHEPLKVNGLLNGTKVFGSSRNILL